MNLVQAGLQRYGYVHQRCFLVLQYSGSGTNHPISSIPNQGNVK